MIEHRYSIPAQQFGELSNVRGYAPCFITGEQLSSRAPPRLILEIDIGELLPVVIADDKAGGLFLDRPRRSQINGPDG
jgi:hypothetical protein